MKPGLMGGMIGLVVGVVIGATVIAPGLPKPESDAASNLVGPLARFGDLTWKTGVVSPRVLPGLGALPKRIELELRRVSGGSMELRLTEVGAQVSAVEAMDAVMSGAADALFGSPAIWADKAPVLALLSGVPFGANPGEFLAWIENGGGREIYDSVLHRMGLHGVPCGFDPPGVGGWFRRPIDSPEAFRGLRMRVAGPGALVLGRLGVLPLALDGPDILPAMEEARLDGVVFAAPPTDLRLGFHRQAKYAYLPGWNLPGTLFDLTVNLQRWQALSEAQRGRIEAVCADSLRRGLAETGMAAVSSLRSLESEGAKLAPWPEAVEEAVHQAWADVVAEFSARNPEFKAGWEAFVQFRDRYAAARAKGYVE